MAEIRADVEAVIAKAVSQVGTVESPPYSNRTPYTRWYGLTGPWCAMFVSWSFWHAGHPLPPIRTAKGFAYCPDIVSWAKANGQWATTRPERGDIILFDFGKNRASHVGIVLGRMKDGRIHTVEGNTNRAGSRDGGAVLEHYRAWTRSVLGFVRVAEVKARPPAPKPQPPKPTLEELDVPLIVQVKESGTLWVVDGVSRRPVTLEDARLLALARYARFNDKGQPYVHPRATVELVPVAK